MRERVARPARFRGVLGWIGTFHALCLRILRRDGARIGLAPGFNVYDTDDQLALVKRILREEVAGRPAGTPRSFLSRISRAKNAPGIAGGPWRRRAYTPEAQAAGTDLHPLPGGAAAGQRRGFRRSAGAHAGAVHRARRRRRGLCLALRAPAGGRVPGHQPAPVPAGPATLRAATATSAWWATRIRASTASAAPRSATSSSSKRTIRERARSAWSRTTAPRARSSRPPTPLISHNLHRKGKTLWTENARRRAARAVPRPGRPARGRLGRAAGRASSSAEFPLGEMAVLYRTNAQSRQMEEIFRREGIPHQVVGSVRFYERKEIKDILAYLKLAANPADDVAFRRVVNTPPRGIGGHDPAAGRRRSREPRGCP